MTVKVTSVRPAPARAPSRLVLLHSRRAAPLWNRRLAWQVALVGALVGGVAGLLTVLVVLRSTPLDTLLTYAAAGYGAGTLAGAALGLLLGATTGAAGAELKRLRRRRTVDHPLRLWVRHHSA